MSDHDRPPGASPRPESPVASDDGVPTGASTDAPTDAPIVGTPGPIERSGTSAWQVAHSIGAGLLGVQSSKNRARDFQQGKPLHFVVGGVIGTLLFLLAVYLFVRFLLAGS